MLPCRRDPLEGELVQLIKRVQVRGFRSIYDATIDELGHRSVLVGKNSSGKSNFLRALNLFFTDESQPHQGLMGVADEEAILVP